jgi:hypothetical protein
MSQSKFPQFSLKTMFGLMTGLGASLALARISHFISALVMIGYVLVVASVPIRPILKRSLIYGAVGGAILFLLVALVVAYVRSEIPFAGYRGAPETSLSYARQYAIPVGGFIGALLGCVFSDLVKPRQ